MPAKNSKLTAMEYRIIELVRGGYNTSGIANQLSTEGYGAFENRQIKRFLDSLVGSGHIRREQLTTKILKGSRGGTSAAQFNRARNPVRVGHIR